MRLTNGDREAIVGGMTRAAPVLSLFLLGPVWSLGINPLWALPAGPALMAVILLIIFVGNAATAGPDDRHWRDRL